jgi:post-segregation antitoxin (ccd killing protein)
MRKTERINVTLPVGVAKRAKELGLNLSGTLAYAIKMQMPKEDFEKVARKVIRGRKK